MNDEVSYQNFLETLENQNNKINSKKAEELNFSETNNYEVVIKIRDLLVCFVLFTIGLFLTIIVFVIELFIFYKNRILYSKTKLFSNTYRRKKFFKLYDRKN
jgi:uncharacterized membrane protein